MLCSSGGDIQLIAFIAEPEPIRKIRVARSWPAWTMRPEHVVPSRGMAPPRPTSAPAAVWTMVVLLFATGVAARIIA